MSINQLTHIDGDSEHHDEVRREKRRFRKVGPENEDEDMAGMHSGG